MTVFLPKAKPLKGVALRKAQRAYLQGYCQTGIVTDGLDAAGVTLLQVETWRENDPEFAALERTVVQVGDDELRRKINAFIKDGNIDVIKAAMKRLPEYSPTKKTEVSVKGVIQHEHISKLPESEIDKIIRAGAELIEAEYVVVGDEKDGAVRGTLPEMRRLPDTDSRQPEE